jgi:hypothetical protein
MRCLPKKLCFLLLITYFIPINSFYVCKYLKINVRLAKRNTEKILFHKNSVLVENKEDLLNSFTIALNDNLVSEMLYIMKYYNISNDSSNPYLYIIMYETLYFGFKILKMNQYREFVIDLKEKETTLFLRQMIFNIFIYISLKNILLHNFVLISTKYGIQ